MLIAHRLEDGLDLGLWADPQVLSAEEAAEFGRSFVRLLAEAADGDLPLDRLPALTGLTPVRRGGDWVRSDRCWVDLAAVRGLAAEALGDRPHLVLAEPDERLGHRLVCHLAAPADRPGAADPADLAGVHRRILDLLPGRPSAITPQWYVVHTGPVPDAADTEAAAAWRERPVLTEGPGR